MNGFDRWFWLLTMLIVIGSGVAVATTPDSSETLDWLTANKLADDNPVVVMVEPHRTLQLSGIVDTMPAPGKTTYMTDTLAIRGIKLSSNVRHKMWLRTTNGAHAMVYVVGEVAARLLREYQKDERIKITALLLWNSRHGPGLLVTDVVHEGASVAELEK